MSILKIPRASDKLVNHVFRELCTKFGIAHAGINAIGSNNLGEIALLVEPSGAWKMLLDQNSYLIQYLTVKIKNYSIRYARGGTTSSPVYDEIFFEDQFSNSNSDNATQIDKIYIAAYLTEKLFPFEPNRTVAGNLTEEQNHLLAIHSSTLERLQELNEDLLRKGMDFRANLESEFLKKNKEKEVQFEIDKKAMEQSYVQKDIIFDEKEKLLGERLKAIDDRDNTHARRQIRDRMLDDVKQRINNFGVSASTELKRRPVQLGIIILFTVLFSLLAWTGNEIYIENRFGQVVNAQVYLLWVRFTLLSMGVVGTLLYYIKWQNKWADQHIAAEFQLQQFYIDVNRANWIIESCLEWDKETDSAIPTDLLKSITSGLFFGAQDNSGQVMHPADELASELLGSASKLKLKIGENELDLDPKKIVSKVKKNNEG